MSRELRKPNRLVDEKSPYLLQHAYNPVDWYAWSDEAFAKAKAENKPVFVSIGYSTCHWCHVMAEESFEDPDIAHILNEKFVSIKVDREERPDLDAIYMTVCQAMTGQGGWPLNVFLTPEQKPFYAGVYFPKESRYGLPGFVDVLTQLSDHFQNNRDKLDETGAKVASALAKMNEREGVALEPGVVETCVEQMTRDFDHQYGGFGQAPKFPAPHQLLFLLRYHHWHGHDEALQMVLKTLDAMAAGGIYDHIGGGFARYSVDQKWLVPHFEKMLYDQAMLMMAYTEAYQVTGREDYRSVIEEIIDYLQREMLGPNGGFYSAEDADSEGEEGKFYLWTKAEVVQLLDADEAELFCDAYDISEDGNFEGKNIPNRIHTSKQSLADRHGLTVDDVQRQLDNAKHRLFTYREKRVHPHKDDKILTAWNGLMIAALAKAGAAFQHRGALDMAERAFSFIQTELTRDGKLMARYRDGDVKYEGFLDDYAYMLWACDALYEATYQTDYLRSMRLYADLLVGTFYDDKNGGFLINNPYHDLIYNPKQAYDGALPSGNSVASLMLFKLARRTGIHQFETYAEPTIRFFADEINQHPSGFTWLLTAYMTMHANTKELAILQGEDDEAYHLALTLLQTGFHPELFAVAGEAEELQQAAPFTQSFHAKDGRTTYYLCHDFMCERPTTDFSLIKQAL
ncbi:thioredoxin domain-containing protein [Tuberibacillus sp. Marseille-P3662]|uniref:thioredoxin domain-containing protein n=1 Tax=Tuberibacillus sp. Marseille-P3662 TaxID=1965358 RepID=UPI000A1CEBE5|nr:thioredoxin domain-containing protein [Tuberibacillus sp. Marseille-P3662]